MSLYSARVAQDSPVFYFENNSSGVNNTGSITPSIVTGSSTAFTSLGGVQNGPHMVNAGYTGEYGFEYSDSTTIFNDRVFTITGLAYLTSGDLSTGGISGNRYIFHTGTSASGIRTNSSTIIASFDGGTTSVSGTVELDRWVHYAVTVDTTNMKLYIDGSLVSTATTPATISMDSQVKYWMRETTSGTPRRGHKGKFDEWAVFNTTLSATTISEHVAAAFGVLYTATPVTASALAVEPALSLNNNLAATPLTASATLADVQVSSINLVQTLGSYLETLDLDHLYKFTDLYGGYDNYNYGAQTFYDDWNLNDWNNYEFKVGAPTFQPSIKFFDENQLWFRDGDDKQLNIDASTYDWTMGFWFKSDLASDFDLLIAYNIVEETYTPVIKVTHSTSSSEFEFSVGSTAITFDSPSTDEWHFIALKYDGEDMTAYIDGQDVATGTASVPSLGVTKISIGAPSYGYTEISNFMLTASGNISDTEIEGIYNSGNQQIQALALMPKNVLVKFNTQYNDMIESLDAIMDMRFNDESIYPPNYGTNTGAQYFPFGENILTNVDAKNVRAFKIENTDSPYGLAFQGEADMSDDQTFTVSFITKMESATADTDDVYLSLWPVVDTTIDDYGQIQLINNTTGVALRLLDGGVTPLQTYNSSYTPDDKYHHYVVTFDNSAVKLYIDGKEEVSEDFGTDYRIQDYMDIRLGALEYGEEPRTVARYIDEFAIMRNVLTAEQIFDLYQSITIDGAFSASAEFVDPTYEAGFGPTIAEPAMTASALLPNVFPFIPPMIAESLFLNPNYEAIDNTSNAAEPMTASALFEEITFDIGEYNGAQHMDASASMGDAKARIPGFWNANPGIAMAEMVEPAISSTLGALIKPQAMPAKAIFLTPPAYKLITDDIWYQKLFLQHSRVHGETGYTAGSSSAYAFLKLFDDVTSSLPGAVTSKLTNNLPWSIVIDNPDSTATTVTYATASNEFLTATPTPVLEVGTYDDYERKAVRFRNTQFKINEDIYKADGPYSLEFTFKTTKADQVIAQGLQRSFTGNQSATSSIGLIDGKLFASRATQPIGSARIFAHPDNQNLVTMNTAYGNKAIADGAWHHIVIQYGFDGRVQFWIDGQLDIQFFSDSIYGRGAKLRPYIMGSNHTNPRWQSDFETSAWSYDAAFFVESGEITEHYTASIKYEPVAAEVATAIADMPEPVVAGNRPRALMLYFWPTSTGQARNLSYANFTSTESPTELETIDYYTSPPQEYQGWDVFPVDITGRYVSDLVKPEAYGVENIQLTTLGGTVSQFSGPQQTLKVNKRRTFRDALTDAPRYIDLINDIDLSKFDMIMFKNYPNDPAEKDSFTGTEIVDEYFNLRESAIFEEFVKSLRAAVDTGLSLMVANAQLALDLKIIDRVETVPDMDDNVGQGNYSDPYSPTQMFGVEGAATLPTPPQYREPLGWQDSWKNNRTRIVNTYAGITDYESLIKTQQAFWQSTDEFRWGGADRIFMRYENKNSLSVGDEFVISTTGRKGDNNRQGYLATPFENVKAGKVITAFANTLRRGLDEIENPYRNYAQSIILEPGDVLDGRQVGGKIYVNFTEEINKCEESVAVELISDYWVNYAYDNGAIDAATRDELLAAGYNQDTTPYWSLNGMHLLQQSGQEFELDTDFDRNGIQKAAVKTRKVNKNGGVSFQTVPQGSVFFSSTYSWQYPMASLEVPSMPTRGFRWLSNREVLEGTVIRPEAFAATAQMPNALGVPDRETEFNAQSMTATATIEETQFSSGEKKMLVLPATATATIVKPGSTIGVPPMLANAGMFINNRASVASEDQVILYLIHVDPILYIREDVIK